MNPLPVTQACRLVEKQTEHRWLIQDLWSAQAVGLIGGEPKCGKSFLALDMAVAVSAAAPCLRAFPVRQTGAVLLFPAEDALDDVHRRLTGICAAAGKDLRDLPIHVITANRLWLDHGGDRQRLADTVEKIQPRLLILDPFIRLHRIDENAACEVAPLLSFLRELQRRFHLAVVLVHHAKKGAGGKRPGQALRGSSELHGWGDSNLYLRRKHNHLRMTVEHRAAASIDDVPVRLVENNGAVALCANIHHAPQPLHTHKPSARKRIQDALSQNNTPMTIAQLRKTARMRAETLCQTLKEMVESGIAVKSDRGYRLRQTKGVSRSPAL